jgi:hypothetical protein
VIPAIFRAILSNRELQIVGLEVIELVIRKSKSPLGAAELSSLNRMIEIEYLRVYVIEILKTLSNLTKNRIEQKMICNFVCPFLENRLYFKVWPDLLQVIKNLIDDESSEFFVLFDNGFFEIALRLMYESNVRVVTSAIYLVGQHFLFSNQKVEIDLKRILKICGSSKSSASTAALWMISNMIVCDPVYIGILMELGILEKLQKVVGRGSLKSKFEALSVMAMMVRYGSLSDLLEFLELGFLEVFVGFLAVADRKFVETCVECLVKGLEVEEMRDFFLGAFCEFNGFELIDDLLEVEDSEITLMAQLLRNRIEYFL